ncbi:MAG: aminoacyl-tRNA hydrolase [Rhodospirillaceae bacterium]|nr:aminoacyl-tRNA hydrolase [Rhodospirillaceae bacterium]
MRLVVGLGNPGEKYAHNRHNIGFMAADEIVRRHNFSPWRAKFQGELSEGSIGDEKILILKPQTFMNESGISVVQVTKFYKIPTADIIVLHDELDLVPGKVRVKRGGGHAGHNGLRSINSAIGDDYARVRLGIGHPGDKDRVTGHVLNDFAKADAKWLEPLLAEVADNIDLIFLQKDADFMTNVARAIAPITKKNNNQEQD